MQIGTPHNPCAGGAGAGQACRVPRRRHGTRRHGAAPRRRLLAHHVDEVLDGQADAGPRRLVAGDEGGHPHIVSGRTWRRDRPQVVVVVRVAPGGSWNSDGEGDEEKFVIWKLVEFDATLT